MGKKKDLLRKALLDIASNFDYADIANYYQSNNWTWAGEVVTEDRIRDAINRYIKEIVEKNLTSIGSGGIDVFRDHCRLGIIFTARGNKSITFGEWHDELSYIDSVSYYFEYIQKKYEEKKRRNIK